MKSLMILILLFTTFIIRGQIDRCSTPAPSKIVYSNSSYRISGNITIPVFFHIVYSNSNSVTNTQIQNQINAMNNSFSNSRYSFYLAGVTKTKNSAWSYFLRGSQAETNMTNSLAKDTKHVFNVYVVELNSNTLGWVIKWPWEVSETSKQNGVVINKGSLPGGSIINYNEGKTLVHEFGHFVGLYHTFENDCSYPGDEVDDTPYHKENHNCPSENTNTCPQTGNDPIHNYMNYTSDPCMNQFTAGQFTRIDEIIGQYKPNLGHEEAPPEAPQNLTWINQGSHPYISWLPNNEFNIQRYEVERYFIDMYVLL